MTEKKGWQDFIELLHQAQSTTQIHDILRLFLTAEERDQLATRVLLTHALLKKNKPQRQISQDLNISIAKITRGSNQLKETDQQLKEYIEKTLTSTDQE